MSKTKNGVFKVTKETMLAALTTMTLVPSQPGVPSSDFYRVSNKKDRISLTTAGIASSVTYIHGSGRWPFEKDFYLDRRAFVPFVEVAKNTNSKVPFKFFSVGESIIIRQGRRKLKISNQPAVPGYGFVPSIKDAAVLSLDPSSKELAYCGRKCAKSDPVTPHLSCVYLRSDGAATSVYATHGKIIYRGIANSKLKLKSGMGVPFPLFLVDLLGTQGLKNVYYGDGKKDSYAMLNFANGKVWQSVSAKAKKFPHTEIDKYMKGVSKLPILLSADSRKFSKTINRLVSYMSATSRQDWVVSLFGDEGSKELVLLSKAPNTEFQEKFIIHKPLKVSFKMDWPLDLLAPVFAYLEHKARVQMNVHVTDTGLSYVTAGDIVVGIPKRMK